MPNNKRQEMVQEFFETLSTMHRLLGDNRTPYVKGSERRKKERRQPQTELLYILSRAKELTIKEVASAMYITSSAATQMVENLVGQGLLERSDDPNDRRIVRVKLTSKGKTQFSTFKKSHLTRLDSILKDLTTEELRTFVQIRKKLMNKIDVKKA